MPPPETGVRDFRQHLEVETPEHVILDYEIAGLGSRVLAAVIDSLIAGILVLGVFLTSLWASDVIGYWFAPIASLVMFTIIFSYFAFFEGLRSGQTPGKRRLGIRVIRDTGHAVTMRDAVVRNLLRIADFLPGFYLLGGLFVAIHPRGKRLGDLVAGTVVVRDRPAEIGTDETDDGGADEAFAGAPELADHEYRVLREYVERATALDTAVRDRIAARLAERFAERFPARERSGDNYLRALYRAERARRRGQFGARGTGTSLGTPTIAVGRNPADRLVVRKRQRWDEFHTLAERASQRGLDSLSAAELPDFARRYREVAADLARARTYRAEPRALLRLERLVAAGHNALYRDERRTWSGIWRFLSAECPAAIIVARRAVLLAFLAFAAPALGGFLLLRERPAIAAEIVPDMMLRRAAEGAARGNDGPGYAEADASVRPFMASAIIQNNIRVSFTCFVGGIFGGVGSLILLAYNGLAIGAFSGHFANAGVLGYLWTFVIGHGVLELFAIWVAGASGFLLGTALISPGELTRHDALVLRGRLAIRMIGAVVVLLVIAGSIEGFVSASAAPLGARIGVSVASFVFLVLYLANGRRFLRLPEGRAALLR